MTTPAHSRMILLTALVAACQPALHPPPFGAGFQDVTPGVEPFSLPAYDPMHSALHSWGLVADLDGSGAARVVMVSSADGSRSRLYSWSGGALRDEGWLEVGGSGPTPPLAALLDLDGDRLPDGLMEDHAGMVAWNRAGRLETPVDLAPGRSGDGGTPGIALWDLDEDGWLDVVVTIDPCAAGKSALRLLFADGPRHYRDGGDLLAPASRVIDQALGVTLLSDGRPMIAALGSACGGGGGVPVHYARSGYDALGYPRFEPVDLLPGFDFSGASPMGAVAADLDGDGLLDWVEALDPRHLLLQGLADGRFRDRSEDSRIAEIPSQRGPPLIPWGTLAVDLDRDGANDLVFAHGNDESAWIHDTVGPQRLAAAWNGGRFQFADVTTTLGLDRPGQQMALTAADLDADGAPDLLVGGSQEGTRVYHNKIIGGGALSVRLFGTSSNPLGLGARLLLTTPDGRKQVALCGSQIGTIAMGEPLVFFGLGDAPTARLEVTWPSGTVDHAEVGPGRLVTVTETPSFTVDPPSRHAVADGKATIRIAVPRPAARVVVESGGAPLPIVRDAAGWVATATAPSAPGFSVVTIRVDGVPLGIRPRLFWD